MHSLTKDKIQGICFDLFNTLVSVGQVPADVGPSTAEILGVDIQVWREVCFSEHHEICEPTDATETLRRLAHSIDPEIPEATIQKAVTVRQRRFDYALQYVETEVLDVLGDLRQSGLRLGLISNASSSEVQAWPASPLAGLFDTTIFSCDCGSKKPDSPIYHAALRGLSLEPDSCLFVGDGGSNEHFGAHAVGMKPVLLRRYLQRDEKQRREKELASILTAGIDTLSELRNCFLK